MEKKESFISRKVVKLEYINILIKDTGHLMVYI